MQKHSMSSEDFEEAFQTLKKISGYNSHKLKIADEKEKSDLENKFFHQIENLAKKECDVRRFSDLIDEDHPEYLVIFDEETQKYLSKNIQIIKDYYGCIKKENDEQKI